MNTPTRMSWADGEPARLVAMAAYAAYAAAWTWQVQLRGRPAAEPERPTGVLLTAAATFRFSRLIGKAKITRPLRAPFTEVDGDGAPAELNESPRDGRRVLGELASCPFCLSMWVATGLTGARLIWPRATVAAERTLAVVAVADAMQLVYSMLVRAAEAEPEAEPEDEGE
ncbi:DUF1360 domain-containing protein [Streptomyces antimicrobicus]|uniref:DUF1360 domain-containing protein n=1 Tax=Streptomyces antimicrobicus TaxID=2883108 RepID=A0ABS8B830_9ACTN|nr:DUF1360 domain-containing protein [Streptomyces antimicrobicus]MCB5180728.1 DUF1360 domain-containing protein [Streptomyces antimicrobicus]